MACLDTILIGVERGEFIKDDLFSACKKFIDCHKHKLYLFNDLRILLGADRDALSMMLDYLLSGKEEGHEVRAPSPRHIHVYTIMLTTTFSSLWFPLSTLSRLYTA